MNDLELYRKEINEIDEGMVELFNRRMQVCGKIAAYKKEHGMPIKDPVRESQMNDRFRGRIEDSVIEGYYTEFAKQVVELSCEYQAVLMEGLKVGYTERDVLSAGPAAKKLFPTAKLTKFISFADCYRAVENGELDVAVLPMENSVYGETGAVMDLLFSGSLYINQVIDLEVPAGAAADSMTRFAAFSRAQHLPHKPAKSEQDNFILVFTVPNEAGALGQTINIIGAHGYNMRALRSRPMKNLQWKYYFYVEAEGDINNQNGRDMMNELSVLCAKLKLVGTYSSLITI